MGPCKQHLAEVRGIAHSKLRLPAVGHLHIEEKLFDAPMEPTQDIRMKAMLQDSATTCVHQDIGPLLRLSWT